MRAAFVSLANLPDGSLMKRNSINENDIEIEPNYLYVRFLPYGESQWALFHAHDTNLVFFEHPMYLDYEIIQIGADPTLPDSVRAYYAAVPVGYVFPEGIRYELLEELFLVGPFWDSLEHAGWIEGVSYLAKRDDSNINPFLRTLLNSNVSLEALEDEAMRLTGHPPVHQQYWSSEDVFVGLAKRQAVQGRWTPRGRITYQDAILGTMPVVGVRVRYGRGWVYRRATTNQRGEFTGEQWKDESVRYSIRWEAENFVLQGHNTIETGLKRGAWNRHLTGADALCAVVWVAAWEYFTEDIGGLSRPQRGWLLRLDIEVRNIVHPLGWLGAYHTSWLFGQSISVFLRYDEDSLLTTTAIYSTTIHELAHNVHFFNNDRSFDNLCRSLMESYARGMEWHFVRRKYGQNNLPFTYFRGPTSGILYSGIVEDLIDTNIEYARGNAPAAHPRFRGRHERVSGFTINQVESAAFSSTSWNGWRDNLRSMFPSHRGGPVHTEIEMNNLFANWWNL